MTGNATNDELAAIRATAVAYLTAFTRADLAGVLATYADDGVLMGPGRPASEGKDELARIYPRIFAATHFDMAHEITEAAQISADWAFVRSATNGTQTDKATGVATAAAYQELFLLRKSAAGAWQTARYCTNRIR